ncbi:MAG: type II secretion system F family protein [Chloroflexota bacterium]
MDYSYVAYNREKKIVRGKLSAPNEEAAAHILSYSGYQVVNLKAAAPLINMSKLRSYFYPVSLREVLVLSRQLALLVASGTDIVTSFDLLRGQMSNKTLRDVIGEIVRDIREGKSLSSSLARHPSIFPQMYHRAIAAGEQGGNLDVILRNMADFLERSINTKKKIKAAMTYPIIISVMAVVVVLILVTFVLPNFVSLFSAFGAKLPYMTRLLFDIVDWFGSYGTSVIVTLVITAVAGFIYTRTPAGKYQWDKLSLYLPVMGRINLLNELSYCCRIMALLFNVGLPLPEILNLAIHSTTNRYIAEALSGVQKELIRGEGLSQPMSHRKIFLPLMVQMIAVGEETGHMDTTLNTVAESYEMESDDRTQAAIGMIQPILITVVGTGVAFVAISLLSAMYGIYGELEL